MRFCVAICIILIFLGCNTPTEPTIESAPEDVRLEGMLVDLNRIEIDIKGYPVNAWVLAITDLIEVGLVQVESVTGGWLIPLYIVRPDTVLIPAQTSVSLYSRYIVEGKIRR